MAIRNNAASVLAMAVRMVMMILQRGLSQSARCPWRRDQCDVSWRKTSHAATLSLCDDAPWHQCLRRARQAVELLLHGCEHLLEPAQENRSGTKFDSKK